LKASARKTIAGAANHPVGATRDGIQQALLSTSSKTIPASLPALQPRSIIAEYRTGQIPGSPSALKHIK
jgi:hypothetical protein